jgi:hypothetical protein
MQDSDRRPEFVQSMKQEHGIRATGNGDADPLIAIPRHTFNHP